MNRLLVVQLLIFISCVVPSFAQEKEHLNPLMVGRLGFKTYTATTVPRASVQPETEFSFFRNYGRYIYTNSASLPQLNLRYGINNRLEVSAGTSFNYYTTRFQATGKACLFCRTQYAKDYITVGFRANILRYHEGSGLLTIVGETYIPGTKAENVRSILYFPTLQLVNSDRLGDKFGYILNLGASIEHEKEIFDFIDLSTAFTYNMSEKANLFLALSHRFEIIPARVYYSVADAGFLYTLFPSLQLQAAIGKGLTDNFTTNDISAKTGLIWRTSLLMK